MNQKNEKVQWIIGTGVLAALVIILQTYAGAIRIGTFHITLTLVPIVIGAIVYGQVSGAILGAVFGIVVCFSVMTGADPGGAAFFQFNPAMTLIVIMLKSTVAGYVAGLLYKVVAKKSQFKGIIAAALIAPIINTGILSIAMVTIFKSVVETWIPSGDSQGVVTFVFIGILGINFLVEFAINIVLIPAIANIIRVIKKA